MNRSDWDKRIQEIKNTIRGVRELSSDNPERNDRVAQISGQMAKLCEDEDVFGRAEWVESDRQIRQRLRDHEHQAHPILDAVKERVAKDTGKAWDWNKELWIGCNSELSFVGFDVWYEFDDELERDRSSGRLAELTSIMQVAAEQVANAESEVRFHSHQTVQEKCGGDYFRYLR
jgi:hypothetical protein